MFVWGVGVDFNQPKEIQEHELSLTNGETGAQGLVLSEMLRLDCWSAVGTGIFPSVLSSLRMKSGIFPSTDQQSEGKAEPACRLWQAGMELAHFPQHRAAGTLHSMKEKSWNYRTVWVGGALRDIPFHRQGQPPLGQVAHSPT